MAEGFAEADRLNQTSSSSADYEMPLKLWNQGGLDLFIAALSRDELKQGASDVSPVIEKLKAVANRYGLGLADGVAVTDSGEFKGIAQTNSRARLLLLVRSAL
eukprot:11332887-Alexandrium_andersonii.AAC.1